MATLKERRAEAVKNGYCGSCVKNEAIPGCKTCRSCVDRIKETKRRKRALKRGETWTWCVTCVRLNTHRWDCTDVTPDLREPGPYLPLQGEV